MEPERSKRKGNLESATEYCADVWYEHDLKLRTAQQLANRTVTATAVEAARNAAASESSINCHDLGASEGAGVGVMMDLSDISSSDSDEDVGTVVDCVVQLVGTAQEEVEKQKARRLQTKHETRGLLLEYHAMFVALLPEGFKVHGSIGVVQATANLSGAPVELTAYLAHRAFALAALPSPLKFWNKSRRLKYPTLAAALPYILPIPATSVACESLFSHVDLVYSKRRQRMHMSALSTLAILHFEQWSLTDFKERGLQIACAAAISVDVPA